jgi:hypothetical protein
MGTTEARRDIEIDYPLAFCHAIAPSVARQRKQFRYMHCSGRLAEKDQKKCLLFYQDGRRIKVPTPILTPSHSNPPSNSLTKLVPQGLAELEMIDFAQNKLHAGLWQTFIVKPSMVLPKKGQKGDWRWLGSAFIGSVAVDELAAAMIDIVQHGSPDQILLNANVVMRGRAALDRYREPQKIPDMTSFELSY